MAYFEDRLSLLGGGTGVAIALIGAATLLGQPWVYSDATAAGLKSVGAILAVALGAALIWLTR